MAKAIENIHNRIRLQIRKGVGAYFSPEQIDTEIYSEVMNLWRENLKTFEQTKQVNLIFRRYIKPHSFALNQIQGANTEGSVNIFNVLNDAPEHRYCVECYTAAGKPVSVLSLGEYRHRLNHPYKGADANFPVAKFEGENLFIAPKVAFTVSLIHKPIKQKYAYTPVSSTKLLYNDDNSIDIDLDESMHDFIVNRVIENLSFSNRENMGIQYGQMNKAQEKI